LERQLYLISWVHLCPVTTFIPKDWQ